MLSLFLLHAQVGVYQNILKLKCCPLGFTLYKAFLKYKKRSGTSLPASFSVWFEEKYFTCYILLTDWYFIAWLPLLL